MAEKVFLGKLKKDAGTYADGENLFLEKHKWDCGWYWGFGYIGNRDCHFHFDSLLEGSAKLASELFEKTNISDKEWWVIRDLFVQAYALRKAAEVYRYGGHQTSAPGVTDLIKNKEMETRLNADLEITLNKLWESVVSAVTPKQVDK